MLRQRQIVNLAWNAVLLGGLIWCWAPCEATACLAHYRSPEWQVADSPLIIVGEVERIENGLFAKQPWRRGFGEDEGPSDEKTLPTIATVRILRILKGRYPQSRIRVGSGPVPTCGGDVHLSFEVGKRSIFLLPSDPQDGGVALHFGGSMLPLTDVAMIESRIARAIAYRTAYLDSLQQEKPKVYVAARQLADSLRAESNRWPAYAHDEKTDDHATEFKSSMAALKERLATVDAETIIAAQAIDWLNDQPNIWWRHELWDRVIHDLAESRQKEAAAIQWAWIRKTLADARVEPAQIDAYLGAVRHDSYLHASLTFPIEPPFLYNSLSRKRDGAVLTTDFILHYYAYDRGAMLFEYAPDFNADVLADLDLRRVKPLVASLYQSDSERLRWLAQQAIAYAPGTECLDIVLDDLVQNGHDWAWQVLAHGRRPKETAARVSALIDLGSKEYPIWWQPAIWRSLKRGECFEEACIDKALTALDHLEALDAKTAKHKAKKEDAGPTREERLRLAAAIREYLAAARASREATSPPAMTAAYRQWFQTHPAKKKPGDE
jgi:hypothetical protein